MGQSKHLSFWARLTLALSAFVLMNVFTPETGNTCLELSADFAFQPDSCKESVHSVFAPLILSAWEKSKIKRCFSAAMPASFPVKDEKSFRIVSIETNRKAILGRDWPVMGAISSGFGYRRHPVTRRRSFHWGIDIKSKYGTPIIAPADGLITCARRAGANGKLVKLSSPGGLIFSFAHLRDFKCSTGKSIHKGDVIGYVGSTGRATGPHLHFAVQKNGTYINPMSYLVK